MGPSPIIIESPILSSPTPISITSEQARLFNQQATVVPFYGYNLLITVGVGIVVLIIIIILVVRYLDNSIRRRQEATLNQVAIGSKNAPPKRSSPIFYIIWGFLSVFLMYWPARLIALSFIPSTLQRFSSLDIGAEGEAIMALFFTGVSFFIIFVSSIIASVILRLRLVILALSVLMVMTLVLVVVGRNSANKNFNTYKDTATQELLARETAITSSNVKIVGSNLEYNNGIISFTLPNRFILLHEADSSDIRTIFSDHSDHITLYLHDGFAEPPHCDSVGYAPCTTNSSGVEIGSTQRNDIGSWDNFFRVFSKKPLREFYEFHLESVTYSIDGRKEPLEANSDLFNNQLKNNIKF